MDSHKRKRSNTKQIEEENQEYWKEKYEKMKKLIEEKENIITQLKNKITEGKDIFTCTIDTKNKADPQVLSYYDEINKRPNIHKNEEDENLLIIYKEKFTEIINKIGNETGEKKSLQEIINHKIGENLEITTFIESLEKAIANLNYSGTDNNKKAMKLFLKFFDEENNLIFQKDSPLHIRQFQMDLIIDIPLNYNDNLLQKECLLYNGFTKMPFTAGIEFVMDKKQYLFNKEYIIELISSNVGILNGYKKMLQIFVSRKDISYDILINEIKDIIDKSNIYFIDFPKDISGMTVCNGDIFIKSEYLCEAMNI